MSPQTANVTPSGCTQVGAVTEGFLLTPINAFPTIWDSRRGGVWSVGGFKNRMGLLWIVNNVGDHGDVCQAHDDGSE